MILPAFGVVSEIIPTFSRKALFGHDSMVYAASCIAFLSFIVWAHHMFTGRHAIVRAVVLHVCHYADRRSDRSEDLQLDRHDVARCTDVRDAHVVRAGLRLHVYDRWFLRR